MRVCACVDGLGAGGDAIGHSVAACSGALRRVVQYGTGGGGFFFGRGYEI